MSNVIKTAKLDFSLLKPYLKTICFVVLFPTFFAAINRSLMVGVSFAMYFIAMTTGYSFTISEKNSMERFYGILPVKKSEIVIGRYIYIIIMGIIALVVSLILQPAVLMAMGEHLTVSDFINAAAIGILLFGIYTAIQLPGYYKFGSIKGRVFIIVPVAGFLVTLLLITKFSIDNNTFITSVLKSPVLLLLSAIAIAIVMFVISITISVKIYKGKEA